MLMVGMLVGMDDMVVLECSGWQKGDTMAVNGWVWLSSMAFMRRD